MIPADPLAGGSAPPGGATHRVPGPHRDAALTTLGALQARWPRAGLAIVGSVASGRHRPDSDVDLLALEPEFGRARQFVVRGTGPRVNLLCFAPDALDRALALEAGAFAQPLCGMLLSAEVLHDPAEWLDRALLRAREQLNDRPGRLGGAAAAVRVLVEDGRRMPVGPARRRLLAALLDCFHLAAGLAALSKQDGIRPFLRLSEADPALGELLSRATRENTDGDRALAAALAVLDGR